WGSATRPFERYLQADYGDKVSSLRTGKRNTPLPNAREVSNAMASAAPRPKPDVSVMFMQWGQFVSHDINLTPSNFSIECCTTGQLDEACMPIDVTHDSYFRK
ncbi:unnamed protein product, partial [Meganyctiphanes norvegica]